MSYGRDEMLSAEEVRERNVRDAAKRIAARCKKALDEVLVEVPGAEYDRLRRAERTLASIRAAVTDYYNDPEGDVDECMSRVIAMLDTAKAGGDEG